MSEAKKNRTTLITFIALLLLTLALNVWMLLPYLLAVLMGVILSFMSKPFFVWLKRKKFGESLAATVTVIAILLVVIVPVTLFSVRAVKQAIAIGETIADNPDFTFQHIVHSVSQWSPVDAIIQDPAALETQLKTQFKGLVQTASGVVLALAAQIPNLILELAIAMFTCYFVLVDGGKFKTWLSDKIPLEREIRQSLTNSFKDTSVSVIWATLAAAAAQSAVIMIGYAALGVPNIALAGGATFIFAWIPMLGCTPVWVIAVAYLYVQQATGKAIAMVVVGLFAGIIDNFVRPWVLQGRSSMHPLVSLVAIFGGIQMFGLLGVFIGPIVIAILIKLLDAWPEVSKRSGLDFKTEKTKS